MAKIPNKPTVVRRFINQYLENFESPDAPSLLLSLVANGIVDPQRLRNYMIIADYHHNLRKYEGHVGSSLADIAEAYGISERQVQNIIYKWPEKYRKQNNVTNPNELFSLDLN